MVLTSHPVRGWTGKNKAFCSPGTQTGCRVIKMYCPLSLADAWHKFQIHVSVCILTIKFNQWARVNFCSFRKKGDSFSCNCLLFPQIRRIDTIVNTTQCETKSNCFATLSLNHKWPLISFLGRKLLSRPQVHIYNLSNHHCVFSRKVLTQSFADFI